MITNAGSQKFDLGTVGKVDQRGPRVSMDDLGSINPGLGEIYMFIGGLQWKRVISRNM